ncbi:hypothetical protein KR018_009482 [Drosophila ironensis]|nr:hypothetical protein KR018_009482 [Drosophila ironensis]
MSLKRYATMLAAYGQNHTLPAATTTASSVGTTAADTSTSSAEEADQSQEHAPGGSSFSSGFSSGSSSSSISTHNTYYSSGLGLYHQQRGGSGSVSSGGGVGGPGGPQTYANVVNGNVNLLLGGAMLTLVTTILCVVCYCCHRNIKKRTEAAYRQQQHQWLEGDPNMEIYSVEQCYETSGLFLGDSTDGLSAVPALHHEPPPSYDAVVLHEQQLHQQQLEQQHQQQQLQLQLQQQQQQLLMQRVSPPPGYRSTLDITHQSGAGGSRGTPDGSVDAVAGGSAGGSGPGLLVNKQLQLALNAQSCCSLQRAEVESMWNAAAAAVAARSGNCLEMEVLQPPPSLPLALQARKPQAQNLRLNTFGRRYLQQSHQHSGNHYRRGCPLCGKFRYEVEADDEPLTALSVESGLNMGRRAEPEERAEEAGTGGCPCPSDSENGNHIACDLTLQDAANGNVEAAIEASAAPPEEPPVTRAVNDENDNAATSDSPPATSSGGNNGDQMDSQQISELAAGSSDHRAAEVLGAEAADLNTINENGIISLDMSKIIDRSGLPTYEGAIKLESSGYV